MARDDRQGQLSPQRAETIRERHSGVTVDKAAGGETKRPSSTPAACPPPPSPHLLAGLRARENSVVSTVGWGGGRGGRRLFAKTTPSETRNQRAGGQARVTLPQRTVQTDACSFLPTQPPAPLPQPGAAAKRPSPRLHPPHEARAPGGREAGPRPRLCRKPPRAPAWTPVQAASWEPRHPAPSSPAAPATSTRAIS